MFIAKLIQKLNTEVSHRVGTAEMWAQEPALWLALHTKGAEEAILRGKELGIQTWTPGVIALLLLGKDTLAFKIIRSEQLTEAEGGDVLAAIAGTTNLGNKTQKLINALQTSLDVILADLRGIEMSTGPLKRLYLGSTTDLEALKSAAAMVFSLTSSTRVLEKNLRWAQVDIQVEVILHAIFANRKSESEQLGAMDDVVLFESEKIQVEVIRQAMIAGRIGFAKLCAEKMLVDNHSGLISLLPHELALVYFASGDLDKADEALPCVSAMHSGDDNKDTGISSVVATGLRILEQYIADSEEFKSRPVVGNGAILPQFMSPVEDILRSDKWFDSDNMDLAQSTCKAAVSRFHDQILNRTFSFSFTLPERLAQAIEILVRRGYR